MKRFVVAAFVLVPFMQAPAEESLSSLNKGIVEVVSPSLSVSLKGGLSIVDAWYTVNSFLVGPQYGYRYNAGLEADIFVAENLSAGFGTYFEPRSIGINESGTLVYMTRNTLLLPVTANYALLPLVTLVAGAYLGVAIGDWSYNVENPAITADANPVEFGWVFGIQLKYPLSYSKTYLLKLVAEISYYYAMTNIARSSLEDFRYRDFHYNVGLALDL